MLFVLGCDDDDDNGDGAATATVTATATPEPPGTPDADGPTGVIGVDAAIAAIEAGDFDALTAMAAYQSVECVTTIEGIGGPRECEEGEAEGTIVEAFPAAACEGYFVRDAGPLLEQTLAGGTLYAAAELPNEPRVEPYWPTGEYLLVYGIQQAGITIGTGLVFEDGRIVAVWQSCGPADVLLTRGGEDLPLLLGPLDAAS
jgi:hypothetical protein